MLRWIVAVCLASGVAFVTMGTVAARAQSTGSESATPTKKITLRQMLETGLKARRPSEFAYIADVVELVEEGRLPEKLVTGTFFQSRGKRRPLQHFQFSLAERGKRLRVPTPTFDPLL